jgi:hypothetical protein
MSDVLHGPEELMDVTIGMLVEGRQEGLSSPVDP